MMNTKTIKVIKKQRILLLQGNGESKMLFHVILEQAEDGWIVAGCQRQGEASL